MATVKTIFPNGEEIPDGRVVSVDHIEDTFIIKIDSFWGVSEDAIKKFIQRKFEVIDIKHNNRNIVCISDGDC